MLRGELAISHEALDEHDVGQATAYLRSWLVDDGILHAREERLARFERWTQATLEAIGEHPDRAHLAAYARWDLQPHFARKLRHGLACASSHRHVYIRLRTAVRLTAWLHRQASRSRGCAKRTPTRGLSAIVASCPGPPAAGPVPPTPHPEPVPKSRRPAPWRAGPSSQSVPGGVSAAWLATVSRQPSAWGVRGLRGGSLG